MKMTCSQVHWRESSIAQKSKAASQRHCKLFVDMRSQSQEREGSKCWWSVVEQQMSLMPPWSFAKSYLLLRTSFMVTTLDSHTSDPCSNLARIFFLLFKKKSASATPASSKIASVVWCPMPRWAHECHFQNWNKVSFVAFSNFYIYFCLFCPVHAEDWMLHIWILSLCPLCTCVVEN